MLSRRIPVIIRQRCLQMGMPANNIVCGYIEKFDNQYNVKKLLNFKQVPNIQDSLSVLKRFKHKKNRSKQKQDESDDDDDDDDEDEDDDIVLDKGSQLLSVAVNSLRIDLILKAGLNMPRNRVETAFYESKLRINGNKVLKKGERCKIGDEIDLIRGVSSTNPDFLSVSRIEILNVKEGTDHVKVKLQRTKVLTIENYIDAWTPVSI
ncbi:mitochondrial transcription rescue factor 1 isoform X1 [Athalia rosae]|uniref:mitochondrial transcription rescue factor 1 isoform X1 n=1 Tax=Athalia rosae TaxID=37344 RepID=UPI0020334499|nr:mitochondrial transcription rescue factor 1 isoform X1 [Athalia rosae]